VGRLRGERVAGPSAVASRGPESAAEEAEEAPSGRGGEWLRSSAGDAQDHVWAWDFAFDRTENGTQLKWTSIVDEHTRECLALNVAMSIASEDLIDTVAKLLAMRGVPKNLRSDYGSDFVAENLRAWLARVGVTTRYVEPASP
jgi:putative transposase